MRAPRLTRVLTTTAVATALAVVPLAGVATAAPAAEPPCAVGSVCVWDHENFTGTRVDLGCCGETVPVGDVQSFVNNQTQGTVAAFFGPGPTGPQDLQFRSTAFQARATKNGITPNGVGPTTAVRVC